MACSAEQCCQKFLPYSGQRHGVGDRAQVGLGEASSHGGRVVVGITGILIYHRCKEVKELVWTDDGMNNTHTDCREVP